MQVNMTRPNALANLFGRLVERKHEQDMRLTSILQNKIQNKNRQSLASQYMKEFSDSNGDVMKMIGAQNKYATGLMQVGDFDNANKIIGQSNTLASKVFSPDKSKTLEEAFLNKEIDEPTYTRVKQAGGNNLVPVFVNGQLQYVQKSQVGSMAGVQSPQQIAQTATDQRQQAQITASENRQNVQLEAQNEKADKDLITKIVGEIDALKKQLPDIEKKKFEAESDEGKQAYQERIDEINQQLGEKDNAVKAIRRKHPKWEQPKGDATTSNSGKKKW